MPVSNFLNVDISKNSVTFNWNLLSSNTEKGYSDITEYVIKVNGTDFVPSFSSSSTSGTITGLSPKTSYEFNIYAKNIHGSGPLLTTPLTISTFAVPD